LSQADAELRGNARPIHRVSGMVRAPGPRIGRGGRRRAVYLDVEVTLIEVDEDGDGTTDSEIVIVEDVPE
jgi:hypothetical protein